MSGGCHLGVIVLIPPSCGGCPAGSVSSIHSFRLSCSWISSWFIFKLGYLIDWETTTRYLNFIVILSRLNLFKITFILLVSRKRHHYFMCICSLNKPRIEVNDVFNNNGTTADYQLILSSDQQVSYLIALFSHFQRWGKMCRFNSDILCVSNWSGMNE